MSGTLLSPNAGLAGGEPAPLPTHTHPPARSTYTANLAAFITVSRIASTITSVQDLRGKAVASHGPYIAELRDKYGVVAVDIPFNSQADFAQMADDVAAGRLVAAIDDEPGRALLLAQAGGWTRGVGPSSHALPPRAPPTPCAPSNDPPRLQLPGLRGGGAARHHCALRLWHCLPHEHQ